MAKIFVTRKIPERGIKKLQAAGYEIHLNPEDKVLKKEELVQYLKEEKYDAVLSLLTDKIDADIFDAAGAQCKIFANYAVGFDNIDLAAAKSRNIMVTNTPGVLTQTVAEHAFTLMLAIAHRVAEADRFARAGKYHGWEPMMLLGSDLSHKKLGIVGLGRIGSRVAYHGAKGFNMQVLYYDVKRNEEFEKELGVDSAGLPLAKFFSSAEEVLKESDFISVHVPLMDGTRHFINADRLKLMKPSAYLVNTSRGPIVDEKALADALKTGIIKGAAIDVFENEPLIEPELMKLENVILTPHIASATEETRAKMSELAAQNIIEVLEGRVPPNLVK